MGIIEVGSLVLGIGTFLSVLALLVAVVRGLAILGSWSEAARSFMDSPNAETPSPLVAILSGVADRHLMQTKMALTGQLSGEARQEKAATKVWTDAVADKQLGPMTIALDQMIPGWRKKLAGNPALLSKGIELFSEGGALSGLLSKSKNGQASQAPMALEIP